MIIKRIANATRVLGAPVDWDGKDMTCGVLPVRYVATLEGSFMVSAWEPTPEELEALQRGETVKLWIRGPNHPVVRRRRRMSTLTVQQRRALRYAMTKLHGDHEVRAACALRHADSSTPTLQRIGETPQAIFLALLVGLAILALAACGNFRPSTQRPASTMTLPNTEPDCVREHHAQQTGTLGAYGTPVVVVTDEPCRRHR